MATITMAEIFNVTTAITDCEVDIGFLTDRLNSSSRALAIAIAVTLLLLGMFLITVGTRALKWGASGTHAEPARAHGGGGLERPGMDRAPPVLRGGVGGLVSAGAAVGTVSAVLTELVVSAQSPPSLGSGGVLAILVAPALVVALLGGRFRWLARVSMALLAAISTTLLLVVSFQLSTVLPRLIILAILTPLFLFLALLLPTSRRSLLLFSSLAGAFLIACSLDLFFLHQGFVDAVGLLVAPYGVATTGEAKLNNVVGWSSSQGRGIIAAWWLITVVGVGVQWWFSPKGDADETWNNYVASLEAHDGGPHPYLGIYTPHPTLFQRLRHLFAPRKRLTSLPERRKWAGMAPWESELNSSKGDQISSWNSDTETLQGSIAPPARWEKVKKGKKGSKEKALGRHDDDVTDEEEESDFEIEGKKVGRRGKVAFDAVDVEEKTKLMDYSDSQGKRWERKETDLHASEKIITDTPITSPPSTPAPRSTPPSHPVGAGISSRIRSLFHHPTSTSAPVIYGKVNRADLEKDLEAQDNECGCADEETEVVDADATLRATRTVYRTSIAPPASNPVIRTSPTSITSTSTSPPAPAPAKPLVVPATPSLLNALQRINEAQRQAHQAGGVIVTRPTANADLVAPPAREAGARTGGEPKLKEREFVPRASREGERDGGRKGWDEWWKNIAEKQ